MQVTRQRGSLGSEAVTRDIRVSVTPRYVPEQSDPGEPAYAFAYTIRIANEGVEPVQLLSRRWLIVDALGREREVKGNGVIGQQPRIEPGQAFEYTSWCPLRTRWGTMEGSYTMARESGGRLEVTVARFYLAADAPPTSQTP